MIGEAGKLLVNVGRPLACQTGRRRIALRRSSMTPSAIADHGGFGMDVERRGGEGRQCQCQYFCGDGVHRVSFISFNVAVNASFQITEVSGDGFDLRSGQTVCNRRHNRRYVWLGRVLSSLFAPIHEFVEGVVGQLAG